MKGDQLSSSHHYARYCSPMHFPNGEPQAGAFEISQSNKELSGNWREFYSELDMRAAIREIQTCLSRKRELRRNGGFALIPIGPASRSLAANGIGDTIFVHDPEDEPPDPSHAVLVGIPLPEAQLAAELLLDEVIESFRVIRLNDPE